MEQYNIKLERLTNSNYPIWSLQMEVLLDSKDLFDEVIKLERPPVKEEDSCQMQDNTINEETERKDQNLPGTRRRKMPEKYRDYIVYNVSEAVPKNFKEATESNESEVWMKAMLDEIGSMEENKVWELVKRPKNEKIIRSRWVFTVKDNIIEKRYKARLVAAAFNQTRGVDFDESFSPVMRLGTFRTLLSLASIKKYRFRLFDVKTAYLNGHLDKPIYLEQPPGFIRDPNYVYLVTKTGKFLGITIKQEPDGIALSQTDYIEKLLKRFNLEACKPVKNPGVVGEDLNIFERSPKYPKERYQEALGSLMFLATATRPDIAFSVCYLSQFNKDPHEVHWIAIKRVLRYLKGTKEINLVYDGDSGGHLSSMSDASWSTTSDAKSFGGYAIKLGGSTVHWKSGKQKLVALSTMEAEMLAFCDCVCETKWFISLLEELHQSDLLVKPVTIETDNQALISWIKNPKNNTKSRHINRKYHFIKDEYERNEIQPIFVSSGEQGADILTKYLPAPKTKDQLKLLGLSA